MFRQDFTCPALLKDFENITYTGLSPSMTGLSIPFYLLFQSHWPVPRSLATTSRISVDVFSSGYLDVSIPRVRLIHLCIQCMIPHTRGVAPFRNPRIKVCSQLLVAYRSVLRLSSPPDAKASTKCSFCSYSSHIHSYQPLYPPSINLFISISKNK